MTRGRRARPVLLAWGLCVLLAQQGHASGAGPFTFEAAPGPPRQAAATASDPGPAPAGAFIPLTRLEIRNDTPVARDNELAYSGVPIAREAVLTRLDDLVVVDAGGRRVPAQFSVLGRWGGSRHDAARPVRWVQVALKTDVPANSTVSYELRRYAEPAPAAHPADVRLSEADGVYTVETGAATFELDPASPALLRAIRRNGVTLYRDTAGAGPHVVDGEGRRLVPRADEGGFAIEETGPVKVVARLRGHFVRARAGCGEDLGYSVRLTFERASSDVGVQFHVVNECGDGHTPAGALPNGAPWWNRIYPVDEVSWRFPMGATSAARPVAGGRAVHRPAGAEPVVVEQQRGRRGPVYRSARVSAGGVIVESAPFFESPFVALADGHFTAMLQMPWMRYREPQALAADASSLSFHVVSSPLAIGEAQGIWSFARLSILDGAASDAALDAARDRGRVALERGLLVHVPVAYLDSTRVMPPLLPSPWAEGGAAGVYLRALEQVHADTIRNGGQWDRQKAFGALVWPDYSADPEGGAVLEPADGGPSSNYWSASASELKQWFVDGDPKWVWDFALPQEYTQLFTNYYNLGTRNGRVTVNYRGGFTPVAGSRRADGEAFRSGWGSDDYTYNQGSGEAFLVRPTGALAERFADAADTFIRRYGRTAIPPAEQRRRDEGLQALTIGRAQAQHVNFLSYAAQFSPANGTAYARTLTSVMDEYVADNLKGGIFCQADYGNENSCIGAWGLFHFVALQLGTFADYLFWADPGDPRATAVRRAIETTAEMYYRVLLRPSRDGAIDASGQWYGVLECTFRDGGATLAGCRGRDAEEPVYAHERPGVLGFVLFGAALTGNEATCVAARQAFPQALDGGLGYLTSGAGWNKGAAQSAHMIAHGLAASRCGDASRTP